MWIEWLANTECQSCEQYKIAIDCGERIFVAIEDGGRGQTTRSLYALEIIGFSIL